MRGNKGNHDDSYLDDHETVIAPLGPYAEFNEDENEGPNLQVGLLISSINDDKIQKEEQQISVWN